MALLKQLWKKWRAFGQVMGDFVARIFMTVFYFTIAIPFGIGVRDHETAPDFRAIRQSNAYGAALLDEDPIDGDACVQRRAE